MAKRTWPPAIKKQAHQLRERGLSYGKIAFQLNVPPKTIEYWFRDHEKIRAPTKWSKETFQYCLKLRQRGESYAEIKRRTGVPESTQRTWFNKELREIAKTEKVVNVARRGALCYKIGIRGRLFYLDAEGDWRLSTRTPAEVGL